MSIAEKLTTIAENEQKVYDAGKAYQNDLLWAAITKKGTRTSYGHGFSSKLWNKNNFLPTYDIAPTNATYMFFQLEPGSSELQIDMEELEKTQGIKFDFSKCSSFTQAFSGGLFSSLNVIDMSLSTSSDNTYVFYGGYTGSALKRINRLIFSENTKPSSTWFGYSYITHIGFDGVLAKNGLDVSPCKTLDKESIISLVSIMSETTSGLTVTFSKNAVNLAFGINIDDETTYPEGSEFYKLRNTKSNWTFNYV